MKLPWNHSNWWVIVIQGASNRLKLQHADLENCWNLLCTFFLWNPLQDKKLEFDLICTLDTLKKNLSKSNKLWRRSLNSPFKGQTFRIFSRTCAASIIDLPWVPYRSPWVPDQSVAILLCFPGWTPRIQSARLVLPEIHWIIISGGGSKVQTSSKPSKPPKR